MTVSDEDIIMDSSSGDNISNVSKKRSIDNVQDVNTSSKITKMEDGTGKRVSFKSFPRSVKDLTLNSVYSSETSTDLADDSSGNVSIFHSKLLHWEELNLSQGFSEVKRVVRKFSNLPLVVYNHNEILLELKSHVERYDPLYLEPLYDLMTGMAQDIQSNFIEFYPEYIRLIADTSRKTKSNASAIKAAFDSLNQVIKIMQRAFLNQLQSDEKLSNDDSCQNQITSSLDSSSNSGIVLLMDETVKIFDHKVSPNTYKMCGIAISQILRKATGSKREYCLSILFEATERADNSNALIELTGIILSQSMKSTSKSLVVNAERIWKQVLEKIEKLDWEEDAVFKLLEITLKNICSNLTGKDMQHILGIVFKIWELLRVKLTSQRNNHNVKLRVITLIVLISRTRKIDFEQEACSFVLNAINKRKYVPEENQLNKSYLKAITELVVVLCQRTKSNKDIALKLMEVVLYSKNLQTDEKVEVFKAASKLDNFESELLLPVVVRNLTKKYSKNMEISKEEYDHVRLYTMVETLADFIFSRDEEITNDEGHNQPYVIEFQCENPNSLYTLPNKLISLLEQRIKEHASVRSNENVLSRLSVINMLRCLTAIRPLHENAELEINTILDFHVRHFESKNEFDRSDQLQIICLAVQVLSDLSCPSDFFRKIDLNVMSILRENVLNTNVARILSSIFYQASLMQTGNESNKLQPIKFGGSPEDKCDEMLVRLRADLIKHLSTTSSSNRKYYLKGLVYLSSHQEKNHCSFKTMLKAENVIPTVGTFRDRVKHLGNIAWGEEDESESNTELTKIRFQGALRFLLGNLSVNFKPLWDPTIKIIDSYLSSPVHHTSAWDIIYDVFHDANEMVIKFKDEGNQIGEKQTTTFRNLILKALTYSTDFIPILEQKNQIFVSEFLHIVRPNSEISMHPCIRTLETFVELFKKFTNLRNMSQFIEVKEVVIQYILGHSLATDNSLKSAVEFFLSAYKSLRPHRNILMELVDNKQWKTRFLALTEETFLHSENSNILAEIIYQLISAKIKRTSKDKRSAQIANRKFIVRTMFQVGLQRGLQFISFFRKRELLDIDNIVGRNLTIFEKKSALRKLDITFDVFMMAAQNANCGKDIFNEILEILVLQGKMVKKEIIDGKREGAAGKRRNKLLDDLIKVFSTLKGCAWSEDQEIQVLTKCVWPLLFSNSDYLNKSISDTNNAVEDGPKDKKYHYLSKLPTLFQLWVDNSIYHRWFQLDGDAKNVRENTEKKNVLQDWMCDQVLVSKFADPEFQSKVFTVVCNLIVASSDVDKDDNAKNVVSQNETVLSRILSQFENWLTPKTCLRRTKDTAPRLHALQMIMKSMKEETAVNAVFFVEKVSLLATKGTLQVQTQSLRVLDEVLSKLKILKNQVSVQMPLCAFKLLANITNYDNKKLVAQILWKHIQNFDQEGQVKAIPMDDNFLHGNYQKVTKVDDVRQSNSGLPEQQFLFLFHFAASEIYNDDFSQRAAAVLCLRDIIRNKKKKMLSNTAVGEDINNGKVQFVKLVDKVMLPVISKGLESTNSRIQGEFMEILLECIVIEDETNVSFLGSIRDVSQLIPSAEEDPESNFFENMKHIQKHRRGRAMRKLALKLDENKEFLSRNCRLFLVYPLVRTYIYNNDYISQPDIVNSAITCIASLASTYNWKDYKNLLLQFLVTKNQPKLLDSAPFRKQRVKILSGILNSFHFPPEEESALKLKEVIMRLLKKVTRMGAAGGSLAIEDQVDIALFVPILKIMIIFPDDWIKSNLSMIIINLSSKLRSRKIEERTAARDVLCQIAKLLGRNYFHFIFSILEGNLQRGYQLHILLFTLNAIMNVMTEGCYIDTTEKSQENGTSEMIGVFNDSLDKIMNLVGNELFGNILEEKRVAALVKKTPEASKTVSFGVLEKLGSFASKGNIGKILGALLASNTTHKYIRSSSSTSSYESLQKLRKAVRSFQIGIVKNKSFGKNDFLLISHGLLSGKLLVAFSENAPSSKSNKALLQEMAFNLLCHNASQPHTKDTGDLKFDQQVEEMKPFKAFITECINEKDVNVVTGCLKYLSLITQSRSTVDTLLEENTEDRKEDFMCIITKKCRQYQPMKNNHPYNYICQILRNLLTHNSNYQFATPDHLKSICLFFQMCLESNYDDVNAIKLLGLLLFKFYTEEASSAFLKLLCVCTIKCKDEMTFNMTKPIILKIVKRHKTLTAAMAFYSQHVTYELVDGRRRAITICNYLLESLCTNPKSAMEGNGSDSFLIKVPSYDTKGLFLASTTQILNEQCCQTKNKLEDLLKTIIYISRVKSKQEGKNCDVFDLIFEWCNSQTLMCRSVGFKLMTLYLPSELSDPKLKGISQPSMDILNKAVQYLGEFEDHNSSPVSAYLIANIMQLFKLLLEVTHGDYQSPAIRIAAQEFIFGAFVKSGKANNLFVHENVSVRTKSLELFEKIFQNRLDMLCIRDNSNDVHPSKSKKTKKSKKADDRLNISVEILKSLLNNICELAKVDAREEELLIKNLTLIYDICEFDLDVSKDAKDEDEGAETEYLSRTYVYKKARSIFIYEKFHLNSETSRRVLFYKFVLKILQNINEENEVKGLNNDEFILKRTLPPNMQNFIVKQITKDRKQPYLEEMIIQIEKEIQNLNPE